MTSDSLNDYSKLKKILLSDNIDKTQMGYCTCGDDSNDIFS